MSVSRRLLARSVAKQLLNGADRKKLIPQLASYLLEYKRTHQVDELIGDIAHELAQAGRLSVTVTTARPLSDDLRRLVTDYIKDTEAVEAVKMHEVVDESIVGGIIIETPARRFDASVASSIKQLKTT